MSDSDTLIVVYTTHEDEDKLTKSLNVGVGSYILKSTHPAVIRNLVKDLEALQWKNNLSSEKKYLANDSGSVSVKEAVLSPRETQVMKLLSQGFLYKEIAKKLNLATGTVKRHLHRIYIKLNAGNKTEAINRFIQLKK